MSKVQDSSMKPFVHGQIVTVIVDEKDAKNGKLIPLEGSRQPVEMSMCPKCSKRNVRTRTVTHPSGVTWASVFVGALVFLPLCWVPLVVDPMKQTDHYCQSCGEKVGTVEALEGCCVKEQA